MHNIKINLNAVASVVALWLLYNKEGSASTVVTIARMKYFFHPVIMDFGID